MPRRDSPRRNDGLRNPPRGGLDGAKLMRSLERARTRADASARRAKAYHAAKEADSTIAPASA
jgi:hypothetical protein